MKPLGLVIAALSIALGMKAQDGVLTLETFTNAKLELRAAQQGSTFRSDIRPRSFWEVQLVLTEVSEEESGYELEAKKRISGSFLRVMPAGELSAFSQSGNGARQGSNARIGGSVALGIKNKLYANIGGVWGYSAPYGHMAAIADSLRTLPDWGYARINAGFNAGYGLSQVSALIAYRPSEHFQLFAGRGRHFIGDGYRSMFLGDHAPNYNYGRIDVDVWKLNYMVLYAQFEQAQDYPNRTLPTRNKYSTMHYLTLHINNYWSVGAFESVIWESEDSVVSRNFDFNYLNPLIFYRPVEYGIGSSDNSLLGFTSSVKPTPKITLYGQFLLDELVLGEWYAPVRKKITGDSTIKTGWWANKQSYQLGFKVQEPFGWKWGRVLAEVNMVRPFTYGHSNRSQSYTHLNTPLAHPLGANFIEWVQVTTWQPGKWHLGLFTAYSRKGYSNNLGYLGEDILISNTDRDDDNREHGNFLLQGRLEDVANVRLLVGYDLIPSWNLRAEAVVHYRHWRTQGLSYNTVILGAGIRTALWNDRANL